MNKTNKFLSAIATLSLLLLTNGCVTKGFQGLIPGKDFEAEAVSLTLSTVWGTQTFKADKLKTVVSPYGPGMIEKAQKPEKENVVDPANEEDCE